MTKIPQPEPLTGVELLEKVRQLGSLSKEKKAQECGYYTLTKNGIERVNMMKFLNALIDAEEADRSACYQRPIVLKGEAKKAFLELVKRPARVNEKLLAAFRQLQ
jgi:hypothetical protein